MSKLLLCYTLIYATKAGNLVNSRHDIFSGLIQMFISDSIDWNHDKYQGSSPCSDEISWPSLWKEQTIKKWEGNKIRGREKVRRTLRDPTMNKLPPGNCLFQICDLKIRLSICNHIKEINIILFYYQQRNGEFDW